MDQVSLYFADDPVVYFYSFTEQADCGRDIMKDLDKFRRTLVNGKKERVPGTYNQWQVKWAPRPKPKAFYAKEFTLRGVRHVHMITTTKMDNEELSQRWRHATDGISDQARVTEGYTVKNPAAYMMKYMAKQLSQDKEQFYEAKYQFKKHERRTGFWKPKGMKRVPKLEWRPDDLNPDDKVQVELGHRWNQESKYYRSWYDDLYRRWGEPFHNYMEWATMSDIKKMFVLDKIQKLNFESPNYGTIFTGVKLYERLKDRIDRHRDT